MKTNYILLTVLILLSLFFGVSINGQWAFLYQFEFVDMPKMAETATPFKIAMWIGMLLSHVGIFMLPFITGKPYFRKTLLIFPLAYLLFTALLSFGFIFLLIPFFILWIVTLIYCNRRIINDSQ